MKSIVLLFGAVCLCFLVSCEKKTTLMPVSASKSASSQPVSTPKPVPSPQPAAPAMQKYVTERAGFVLYMPVGWKASEGTQGQFRTLFVTDPSGSSIVALFSGVSPTGKDVLALARYFTGAIQRQFPDLMLSKTMMSPDKRKIVFDGVYSDNRQGRKAFRTWIQGGDGNFSYSSIEAPEGKLDESKHLLLTILANVSIMKGAADTSAAPVPLPLVQRRLQDGSAVFSIPQNWTYQGFGTGAFVAKDATGLSSFMVGTTEFLTPQVRVRVPRVITADFQAPHKALQLAAARAGVTSDIQFVRVIPRADMTRQGDQRSGPIIAEDFIYTFTTQGRKCKAYSFGICFGSRLNTDWKLWHITVSAPLEQFEALVPSFVSMVQSYRINDRFAQNYVAQGMAHLRQMQRDTARIVTRNAQEIHQMMQSAYNERQKSMDYIDYQRTNYIRGTSDWISSVEGGTVYHSDRWGTRNTATGDYYEGQPYNYFNQTGQNPRYNEQMQEINSRALYEANRR